MFNYCMSRSTYLQNIRHIAFSRLHVFWTLILDTSLAHNYILSFRLFLSLFLFGFLQQSLKKGVF